MRNVRHRIPGRLAWRFAVPLAGACLAVPATRADGQESCTVASEGACSVSLTVKASTPSLMWLRITEVETTLPSPSVSLGRVEYPVTRGPTARVSANGQWQLQIAAAEPAWQGSGPLATHAKPGTDLQWSVSPEGPFTGMSMEPATVATGRAVQGQIVQIYLRTLFDPANDPPGEYALTIRYTLTAP